VPPPNTSPTRRRKLPGWKKLLFAAFSVAVCFALLELVLLAAGLRPIAETEDPFVGFAANLPLFVEQRDRGSEPLMVTAENKIGIFNAQRFPRRKGKDVYRIFCLGGSTTYGHPYTDEASFAAWLRKLLPCVDSSRNWEVINAGGISYASYRVAALMEELNHYEPDLYIVYTGHNEFLERRTYGALQQMPDALRRISGTLSHTRTYTALRQLLLPARRAGGERYELASEVDARLDHTIGPADYHRDDLLRRQIVEHCRFNLRRMVALAHAAGAQVLFVTPAANLKDCSPFKSEHRAGLSDEQRESWTKAYREGRRLQKEGRNEAAVEQFRAAEKIDDRHAELHFRLGQALLQTEQFPEAERALERALDEDICPLRAPAAIVEAVRETARQQGVPWVDFQRLVAEESQQRLGHAAPGNELFLDHVHLSVELTGVLAGALVAAMAEEGILKRAAPEVCRNEAAQQINELLGPEQRGIGLRNIAKVYSWAGKMEEAGPAALAALEVLPDDRESMFIAGAYLKQIGRLREGTSLYRRALEKELAENPDDVEARLFLAAAAAELGDLEEARQQYLIALKLRPESADAHYDLAVVLKKLGDSAAARRHLEEALRLNPEHPEAREQLE
jgi:tetratricopeptide (TPR) repeat protein